MTAPIEPGHVMSIQAFKEIKSRIPASEGTKQRRCVADDIRSMMGPHYGHRHPEAEEGTKSASPP